MVSFDDLASFDVDNADRAVAFAVVLVAAVVVVVVVVDASAVEAVAAESEAAVEANVGDGDVVLVGDALKLMNSFKYLLQIS